MIPKKIHYFWIGGNPKPESVIYCMDSWKKHCPDYQIIEWNEENYDINAAPLFVRQAIEKQKWAFATDYIRLDVVYRFGGILFGYRRRIDKKPGFISLRFSFLLYSALARKI